MKCEVCGRGVFEGIPNSHLIRQNEKGVKGIWRCEDHNFKPVDPEIRQIVDALSQDSKGRTPIV